jgi:hypothetical protein
LRRSRGRNFILCLMSISLGRVSVVCPSFKFIGYSC